jgi:hypothetical protein
MAGVAGPAFDDHRPTPFGAAHQSRRTQRDRVKFQVEHLPHAMRSESVQFGFVPALPACSVESRLIRPGQFMIWITRELLIAAPFGVPFRYFELFMGVTNIILASLSLFHTSPTAQSPHLPPSQ